MENYIKRAVRFFFMCAFMILISPNFVSALIISEINFDPNGSDTDREWIEVFNETQNSIDLSQIKFFENNVNHGIDSVSGDVNIMSGEYVVVVQDLNKFKIDFPSYSGKIFQSSFSLSNSGEILSLKSKEGNTLTTVNYGNYLSGVTSGQTVVLDGTNYTKANPNPGSGNLVVGQNTMVDTSTSGDSGSSTNSTTTNSTSNNNSTTTDANGNFVSPIYYHRSYWPESEKVYLEIGENKIGLVGADIDFVANAVMGDKRPVTSANYFWSFGDGETSEGKKVFHIYKYPGEYTVDAEVYSGGNKKESRIYVKIIEPEIAIKFAEKNSEKFVELTNKTKDEIDIGGFQIKSSGGEFEKVSTLPKKLSLMPLKKVAISQETLKFATSTTAVSLLMPNGKIISESKISSLANNNPIKSTIYQQANIASNTVVSVFTKEEFEKKQRQVENIKSKPVFRNALYAKKVATTTVVNNQVIATNQDSKVSEVNTNSFVVKNEGPNFVKTILDYFGI